MKSSSKQRWMNSTHLNSSGAYMENIFVGAIRGCSLRAFDQGNGGLAIPKSTKNSACHIS